MKKDYSVKTIVAIGIGSALFVVLGRFAVIPTGFANTNIETAYSFLALISVLYGPVVGGLVGLIGHALKDFTTYGSAWWSWVLCSGIIGVIYGFIGKKIDLQHGNFSKKTIFYFVSLESIGNLLVWGAIAPSLDILLYSEPASKVFTQGLISSVSNLITVGVIGTLLMIAYAAAKPKKGSLTKE